MEGRFLTETEDRLLKVVAGSLAEDIRTLVYKLEAGCITNKEVVATLKHILSKIPPKSDFFEED